MRVSELVGLNLTDFKDDTVRVLGKGGKRGRYFSTMRVLPHPEQYLPKRLEPNEAGRGRAVCQQKAQPHQCADGQVAGKEIYRSSRTRPQKILRAQAASHSGNAHVPERRGYPHTAKHSWSLECGYDHDLHPTSRMKTCAKLRARNPLAEIRPNGERVPVKQPKNSDK